MLRGKALFLAMGSFQNSWNGFFYVRPTLRGMGEAMCEKSDYSDSLDTFEIVVQKNNQAEIVKLSDDSELESFSDEDICTLSVLKERLELLLRSPKDLNKTEYVAECLSEAVSSFSLSEREGAVLRLIADGRSNNDISEQIHVSLSTVKKHVYNIFNKAGVNSRTQLLNLVFEMGR